MTCEHMDAPRRSRIGCLHPHGVCMVSLHRINTETMTKPVAAIKGKVQEIDIPDDSRITAAKFAYRTNRPKGLRYAIHRAWVAFKRN